MIAMNGAEVKDQIRAIIHQILDESDDRPEFYVSMYEAVAIVKNGLDKATDNAEYAKEILEDLWRAISLQCPDQIVQHVTRLRYCAEDLAKWAILLSVVCEKTIRSKAVWGKRGEAKMPEEGGEEECSTE